MPTHRIIQKQQELIRSLNSLMESYEQDVKRATAVIANANEVAKIEHSRKMQEADVPLGRIRFS